MSVVALLQLHGLALALAELGQDHHALYIFVFAIMQAVSLQGIQGVGGLNRLGETGCSVAKQSASGKPSRPCTCTWLQALAYQWLGRWYDEIDQDYKQAQDCYERAVALDDDDILASKTALCLYLTWLHTRF